MKCNIFKIVKSFILTFLTVFKLQSRHFSKTEIAILFAYRARTQKEGKKYKKLCSECHFTLLYICVRLNKNISILF